MKSFKALLRSVTKSGKIKVAMVQPCDLSEKGKYPSAYVQCSNETRSLYDIGTYFIAEVTYQDTRGFYSAKNNVIKAISKDSANEILDAEKTIKEAETLIGKVEAIKKIEKVNDELGIEAKADEDSKPKPKIQTGVEWDDVKGWVPIYE